MIVTKITESLGSLSGYLKTLIILALIAGIILRFTNLDGKLYSNDETFSTTFIFGHDLAKQGVIDNQIITAKDLQNYQRFNPDESFAESVDRLIKTPYIFPPLYSIGMQVWSRFLTPFIEHPAIITRSYSVLIGLSALPCMYWLCWELSQSKLMAWLGTAIFAVSPFHLQYSQIVRTYSLFTFAILLASASLLKSIRRPSWKSWLLYAITISIGLYANILFGFVIIAHAIFVCFSQKFQLNRTLKTYALSTLFGLFSFLPWLIQFMHKPGLMDYAVEQVSARTSLLFLLSASLRNERKVFIDFNDPWIPFTQNLQIFQRFLTPVILILILVSILYCLYQYRQKPGIFSLCLVFSTGGLLLFKDAIWGGTASTRLRYIIPTVIGIELSVIYFLHSGLVASSQWRKRLSQSLTALLIMGGIFSCGIIAKADSWWAFGAPDYPAIARRINQEVNPVVIYEDWGDALTMSYLLDPDVHNHLTRNEEKFLIEDKGEIYQKFDKIILFKPSETFLAQLQQQTIFKVSKLFSRDHQFPKTPNIWKLEN